jgi:hypothetical protein
MCDPRFHLPALPETSPEALPPPRPLPWYYRDQSALMLAAVGAMASIIIIGWMLGYV